MSEIKVCSIKKNVLLKNKFTINEVKKEIIDNAFLMFGVTIIKSDISLSDNNLSDDKVTVDLLGYDESYQLVVFEFRKDKYGPVVKSGFYIIDYIRANGGKVKTILKDYLPIETVKNINISSRLIVIGVDFNKDDEYGIKQTPYEIDLVKVALVNDLLIYEKTSQSYHTKIKNLEMIKNNVFKSLHEEILSLGDDVTATGNENFICYRRLKNICYILFDNGKINISIRYQNELKSYKDITLKDLDKVIKLIKKAYEEN